MFAVLALAVLAPGKSLEDTANLTHHLDDSDFRSNVEKSIVIITTVTMGIDSDAHIRIETHKGSGIVISDRLILTARHVVEGISMLPTVWFNGVSYSSSNTKALDNTDAGFILLSEPIKGAKPIEWNLDPSENEVRAYAFGAWGGLQTVTYTAGMLSRTSHHIVFDERELDWVLSGTTMLFFGFSGGAIVDADGRLLGVNFGANIMIGTYFVDARPLYKIAFSPDLFK
jgi:serine protease Do